MDNQRLMKAKRNSECEVWISATEKRRAVIVNSISHQFTLVKYTDDGFTEEVSNKRIMINKSHREKLQDAINLRIEYERKVKSRAHRQIPVLPSRGWLIGAELIQKMGALKSTSSSSSISSNQTSK